MSIHLPSSSQPPGLRTHSAVHLPNPTSNDDCSLDPYFHDEVAPSNFQLGRQGPQIVTTVALPPPPSRVSVHRNYKVLVPLCETGFSQKLGFNRHYEDKHSPRNPCPYLGTTNGHRGASAYLRRTSRLIIRELHPRDRGSEVQRNDEATGAPRHCPILRL